MKRVFLVEDNRDNADLVEDFLCEAYEVSWFEDGPKLLSSLDPIRKAFRAGGLRFSATGGPAYGWQVSGFRLPALPMSRY